MVQPYHRRALRIVALLCSFIAVLLSSSFARATTINGGNIVNQTWTPAGNPYLILGDITVPSGAFLTISAGTIVQFASSDMQLGGADSTKVEVIVQGTLTVNGTTANPVVFQAQNGTAAGTWYGIIRDRLQERQVR